MEENMQKSDMDATDTTEEDRPTTSQENLDHVPMQNVLQLAVTAQTTGAALRNSDSNSQEPGHGDETTADSQTLKWLHGALGDITRSPVDILKDQLASLRKHVENKAEEEISNDIDNLLESCCEMDVAIDFHRMDGFSMFTPLLNDFSDDVKWRGLELLAVILQNNPKCQEAAVETGIIPKIQSLLDNSTNVRVKTKALLALSGALGELPEPYRIFNENDGVSSLMRAIQSGEEKLEVKGSILLSRICHTGNNIETICKIGVVRQLINLLRGPLRQHHEHVARALLEITRFGQNPLDDYRDPQLGFKKLLEFRIKQTASMPEHNELRQYCTELLFLCFSKDDSLISGMEDIDR